MKKFVVFGGLSEENMIELLERLLSYILHLHLHLPTQSLRILILYKIYCL